jgi:hypothetical protein
MRKIASQAMTSDHSLQPVGSSLACEECGAEAYDGADRWRAYLAGVLAVPLDQTGGDAEAAAEYSSDRQVISVFGTCVTSRRKLLSGALGLLTVRQTVPFHRSTQALSDPTSLLRPRPRPSWTNGIRPRRARTNRRRPAAAVGPPRTIVGKLNASVRPTHRHTPSDSADISRREGGERLQRVLVGLVLDREGRPRGSDAPLDQRPSLVPSQILLGHVADRPESSRRERKGVLQVIPGHGSPASGSSRRCSRSGPRSRATC